MDLRELIELEKEEQLKLLYKKYGKHLFRYASVNWKIEEDASWEIVYKVLYKVLELFENKRFETEQQLRSYLFKALVNYLKNHLRDEKVRLSGHKEVDLDMEPLDHSDEKQDQSPAVKALSQALDQLDEWQRILVLMRVQGFSYREISSYIDKSPKNLKVYYRRLKEKLETQLLNIIADEK